RSQLANRQAARARLADLLRDAIAPPPRPRVPTRPGRAANERRLQAKRSRATVKRTRRYDDRNPDLAFLGENPCRTQIPSESPSRSSIRRATRVPRRPCIELAAISGG
ncbi:MAG: hypothetical protein ACRDP5_10225, partial [Streptosporangiaceae bacterium]